MSSWSLSQFLAVLLVPFAAVLIYQTNYSIARISSLNDLYHEPLWLVSVCILRLGIPTSLLSPLGISTTSIVDAYIKRETPIAKAGVLANIGPHGRKCGGAKPGVVIASPSTKDPDYFYTWTRDAALVMKFLVDEFTMGDSSLRSLLDDFVLAQRSLQQVSNPSGAVTTGGLGEPKFQVNLSAFTEPWGRPQHGKGITQLLSDSITLQADGPALRATTLITYANALIKMNEVPFVAQEIWPVIQLDMDYVVDYWNRTGFDLWEEVSSSSFFTTAVQHRALREGANLAHSIGQSTLAGVYSVQADNALCFMQSYWNPADNFITANTGGGRSGKDANSVLASIHTFDIAAGCDTITFQPCSDKALSNLRDYIDSFRDVYTINHGIPVSEAIATGRYPEDIYQGGHPWYLTTSAVSEQLYYALMVWETQQYLQVTNVSLAFFQRFLSNIQPGDYPLSSFEFTSLNESIRAYADGFLAVNAKYTPVDGSLAEQYHRDTGKPLSALDLTWSYAASLTAFNARTKKSVPSSWGAKGLTIPPVCSKAGGVSVTFNVNAKTVYGENIYVAGSSIALGNWAPEKALQLSSENYPVWTVIVHLQSSSTLEFKYIRKAPGGSIIWEEGPNRLLTIPKGGHLETHDKWK